MTPATAAIPHAELAPPGGPATRGGSPVVRRAGGVGAPVRDARLGPIREKVLAGERLSIDEGMVLYETPDIWGVCEMADAVRRRLHGDVTYYNINRHLNYSNVCALSCKFCDFYAKKDDADAYTRDLDYIRAEARKAIDNGATEMHIVGGLQPYLPFSYYTDMLSAIREIAREAGSDIHLKAFTAVEIVHLAKIAKVWKNEDRKAGIRWVLQQLKDAGLGSLPGGGAEVFDDRVHDEAFKGKIRSDAWLDVHRVAHELGINSNATMLYGHIEDRRERLVHMDMLRRAQDESLARLGYQASSHQGIKASSEEAEPITLTRPGTPLPEHIVFGSPSHRLTVSQSQSDAAAASQSSTRCLDGSMPGCLPGYFQTIIPLPFFPDNSELEHLPGPAGLENLRTLAIARLMLDNFPHVKAFWIMQTLGMAQLMLQSGADDIDGTVVWYDITKVGGASTHQEVSVWTLQKAIREAGFVPVERDTVYRRVERNAADGKTWRVTS
ncbi:MAG TPA: radical SAM protein [Phycisphaerales bacterium]|nr:radical SAM protein [Phycisphaerales bacterium]